MKAIFNSYARSSPEMYRIKVVDLMKKLTEVGLLDWWSNSRNDDLYDTIKEDYNE